jgi:Protein of unknown function (DUF3224)
MIHMRSSLPLLTLSALLVLPVADAPAAERQEANGTFLVEEIVPTSIEPTGGVCLVELQAVFRLDGTFEGLMASEFLIVHFGPCDEPAEEIFVAWGTFEGTVDGAAGAFEYVFFGDIDEQGNAEGDLIVLNGTGELDDLRGGITLTGVTGVGGVYSGRFRLAR